MKKTWIAAGILLLYGLLTSCLTLIIAYSYIKLGEVDPIFSDAEPLIRLFISGFPLMKGYAIFFALAQIGINRVYQPAMNAQQMKGVSE